jgi:hypothetical protein
MIDNTGKGKDRKGIKCDGLKHRWRWIERRMLSGHPQDDHRRLPCQVCEANVETSMGVWTFNAIDWGTFYQAEAAFDNNLYHNEVEYPTRLEAQKAAEQLPFGFATDVLAELYGYGGKIGELRRASEKE